MIFDQLLYERPNIVEFEEEVFELLGKFDSVNSFEEQFKLIDKINSLRNHVLTMLTIAEIRAQLDTSDKKYQEEQKFINKNWPVYEKVVASYYDRLIRSTFKEQISKKYGKQLLNLAEINVNTIGSSVIDKLKRENNLISEYTKMMANAKIEFKGEERNLAQLDKFVSSPDRMLRKQAIEKKYELLEQYENRIDELFDSLIQVRTQIAKELGYNSFVELGYARLSRVDYGQQEVADFRKMILKYMAPISEKLREKQRIRIGIENLTYYDEEVRFKTGEAILKGDSNWMIEKFKTIFQQLSEQPGEIFKLMHANKYMGLTIKENKARGAYATYLCNEKIPYIFANFNGSRKDVKVLAHEFGHAFQMAIFNQNNTIPEYILPTKEACEISSIAMEFLIWPYMEEIFGDDAMNYRYSHLEDAIFAMPYRASIDEFQHFIYTNPNLSIVERKKKWVEIEQKYMPYKTTYNHPYLKKGNLWHQQIHLFKFPFYYIDYAMAQICALQIWSIAQIDMYTAWNVYMDICKQGGRLSFLDLLDNSGIASPFKEEAFENMIKSIDTWFSKND
ncbi:M3 family oligoendopeptidase [Viridibacillus sp. FSL R5-0477]|uniref:Oligoendopeptidase n=1 Tax=Viridibacillus arenosi FSL R5-213 TaxID=1227360 RepID=W4EW67_9BACL|nr:M3 family oligoendopeptidase [Viridibacillus arenosi]ETT84327.1 oligoendopeptidase [Viridibacillus arenosi FSL R5-213]OMC89625.1 M3 family oligoendopeptidase [Viridibacillus arenosi]